MSFRMITASFLALAFAVPSAFANSLTSKEQIHCPAITSVQQAAEQMDTAEKYGAGYVAYSSNVAFNEKDRPWYVGAANLSADTTEAALVAGKETVKNISYKKNEVAMKNEGFYYCLYGNGDVVAITGDFGTRARGMMFKN